MKLTRWKAAGIAAGAAVLALLSGPVHAAGPSVNDATGLDYDPGCLLYAVPPEAPPGANSIDSTGSPGGTHNVPAGDGCKGLSTYDGGAEGIDLNGSPAATLSDDAANHLVASWTIDGAVPVAGSTAPPNGTTTYDLPDSNFVGGNYFALFQNKHLQTNVAYTPCAGGPKPVLQRWGSWKDGYHFFVAFSASWDNTKWIHSAQLGLYSPDGGFGFFELGVDDGSGWVAANPNHPYDSGTPTQDEWKVTLNATRTQITVTAPSIYKVTDGVNCAVSDPWDYKFAEPGNELANIKALTTANQVVTLPVTIPASVTCNLTSGAVCESDITSVGGFVFWADTTDGSSTAGLANTNISDIALTAGLVGGTDTLGPGPTCPTPTLGGTLQDNPLFTPDTACHIDDDGLSRGSLFQEFWDTTHSLSF